jgi:ADP-ribose pyrophosphatase YjhB (NUDIX family)
MPMSKYMRELRAQAGKMLLVLPSVTVAALDHERRILLVRHAEGNVWALPGGAVEPEEVPADAAVRETWEETGVFVRLTKLSCVCGGPDFVVRYKNGDETSYVMTVFEAEVVSGAPRADGVETLEARWFSRDEARGLNVARWMPEVLERVFAENEAGRFREARWAPAAAE